jgi:hypothetical protein
MTSWTTRTRRSTVRAHGRRPLVAALALATCILALGGARTAFAQNDHLTCYKAKDTAKVFKSAKVDLLALQDSVFPTENCQIKAGSKMVCVPSQKLNVSVVEGQDNPFVNQDLTDVQLCYKVKCPKVALPPLTVTDQFGTRALEKFKASRLCVPAIQN